MALDIEIGTLRKIPLFQGLDIGKLKLLAFTGQRLSYPKGTTVFLQGEVSDAVYVILEGEVDVIRSGDAGQVVLARLGATEVIGEIGVLCETPRNATIATGSDAQLLRIEKGVFLEIVREMPQLAMAIIRELGHRLDRVNQQLADRGQA